MHMLGAVSHVDTFDYKPMLEKMHGQELPESVRGNRRLSTMVKGQTSFPIIGPIAKFLPGGKSGTMISDLMAFTRDIADDICVIRTMNTEHVNHDPASKFLHTGFQIAGRPSGGAWVNYALGSNNQDLPSFVVMSSGNSAGVPIDAAAWGAGFAPSHYQGVLFRAGESPVPYVGNPKGLTKEDRRSMLDAIAALSNSQHAVSNDPEIPSKLSQYEMAYRMQASVPDLMDLSQETSHTLELYGASPGRASFANNCLLARRLIERGVRMVQLFDSDWDHHSGLTKRLPEKCRDVDQPMAALIRDLKQRGLLDETLIVWGSEFGRTPLRQGIDGDGKKTDPGRDHHKDAYTMWLAGGGIRGGISYGETDEFGFNVARDPVHTHDLNATVLHLLGLDHERLTFRYQGREYRLTDVHGNVVTKLLA
jgi:hypothetical protein